MQKILSLLLFVFIFLNVAVGQVTFVEDGNVSSLMTKFKTHHRDQQTIKAWRIQVVTTNDRRTMESAISKLQSLYPELQYDWKHVSPYYQVKVGGYEEKQDLQQQLLQLKKDFPSAIPVMDDILKSSIL